MHFSYQYRDRHPYPIIPVTLSYQGRSLHTEGLLDSGASFSLFSARIAEYLGLSLETGSPVELFGVGGRILGYQHEIALQVGDLPFEAVVVFSDEFTSSFNLLGRDNFFEQFRITFDERQKFVELGPAAQEA